MKNFFDWLSNILPFIIIIALIYWFRKKILGLILIIVIILIPGWRMVFHNKNFSQIREMIIKNPVNTISRAAKESFNFYKNWFWKKSVEEGKKRIEKKL